MDPKTIAELEQLGFNKTGEAVVDVPNDDAFLLAAAHAVKAARQLGDKDVETKALNHLAQAGFFEKPASAPTAEAAPTTAVSEDALPPASTEAAPPQATPPAPSATAARAAEAERKRAKNVSESVHFEVSAIEGNKISIGIKDRPASIEEFALDEVASNMSKTCYGYTDRQIGPRETVGNKGGTLCNKVRPFVVEYLAKAKEA